MYGADVDTIILFQEDRIKTFRCDQLDETCIRALWLQPDLQAGMELSLRTAYTHLKRISRSLKVEGSLEHLRTGGIYVIEDIPTEMVTLWCDRIKMIYSKRCTGYEFALVILPNRLNRSDTFSLFESPEGLKLHLLDRTRNCEGRSFAR